MASELYWMATFISGVTFVVHTFVGGVYVARPLLANTTLPRASKWLSYYCWHIATILIAAIGVAFAYCALRPDRIELAIGAAVVSAMLAALSTLVGMRARINPLRFPSTSLFTLLAALGFLALAQT